MPLPAKLHLLLLPPASAAEAQWDEEALGSAPAWLQSKDDARRGSEGEALASIAMAAAFDDLLHKKPKRAQRFLTAMAEAALSFTGRLPSSQDGLGQIREQWVLAHPKDEQEALGVETWDELLRSTNTKKVVANATSYAAAIGVPVPSVLVNGKLLLKSAYQGQHAILQTIAYEQQALQQATYTGKLNDESNIAEFFLSQGVLSAYHPDIAPELAQRGGEEGQTQETKEVVYQMWPAAPFLQLPFLNSVELQKGPAEG
ncbi:unnamed protein product, partial [Polarella glacialis]